MVGKLWGQRQQKVTKLESELSGARSEHQITSRRLTSSEQTQVVVEKVLKDWQTKAQEQERRTREIEQEKVDLTKELAELKTQVLPSLSQQNQRLESQVHHLSMQLQNETAKLTTQVRSKEVDLDNMQKNQGKQMIDVNARLAQQLQAEKERHEAEMTLKTSQYNHLDHMHRQQVGRQQHSPG